MDWSEQSEAMSKAWIDAQKKMWGSWYELVRQAPAPPGPYPGMAEQWRQLVAQGLDLWTFGAEPTARAVAERMYSGQEAVMRFVDLSTRAWKAMAPKIEFGGDWQEVVAAYAAQFRDGLTQTPATLTATAQNMGELWRLYLEEMRKLAEPWVGALRMAPGGTSETREQPELVQLTSVYWDAYERTFGRLLESPSLGYSRELNEKLLRGFDAWLDFRRASAEYQVLLADGWARAFERLMHELAARAEEGETSQSLKQLLTRWGNVTDKVFEEVFRSDTYMRAQGRLVNTAMAYRIREQECADALLKSSHLPSRRELDEAYRTVYDLRKEMKALRRTVGHGKLDEAYRTIAELREEVAALKKSPTNGKLDQAVQTIAELREEVDALKKTLPDEEPGRPGAANPQPRNSRSATRRPTAAKTRRSRAAVNK
jgi:polyhydroxyalkanoate synthase subunit PhaE